MGATILGQDQQFLLLGGPKHGQYHTVPIGQNESVIMAPAEPNSLPTPVKYVRREIIAETQNGKFSRVVFVEQNMPVEYATSALQAILLQNFATELVAQWMEGGERIDSKA